MTSQASKPLRIGHVDLDTSHPGSFVPILRELGHEVTAVFDGGAVYPPGYAAEFALEHGIPHACESLEEMVGLVDAVLIHSCNWDVHVQRARPFVEAGKAVFIDKPLAGNVRDLQQMLEWSKQGAVITGGSALRYCSEVREQVSQLLPEEWVYGLAGCAVDEFNYGIHGYSMLHGLLGPGIVQAQHLGTTVQRQVELTWADGRRGIVSIGGTAGYLPFYATLVTQKQVKYIQADNNKLYQSLLEGVLPYLAGEAPPLLPFESLIEAELAAIAAKLSAEQDGRPVLLRDIPQDYAGYDGAAFAAYYKELKFPSQK
ncbi:Gfo/Idh/MocA family protein [Paenibacillus eucommiae]|uniref:Gfo/Idh/MocA-like oxidoreductase N-terminal domain-containing protein n=1 Tax=Paenibacillus eucommiae TaxID=1355755 RepID=A0ABS4IT40_9BACL|nr:Gfo/Idh/MocA family oxidoreductase [Paenibacillus eucommiae]MBP1990723.1 hypothetical protein [Paenibacillus eucommiae]